MNPSSEVSDWESTDLGELLCRSTERCDSLWGCFLWWCERFLVCDFLWRLCLWLPDFLCFFCECLFLCLLWDRWVLLVEGVCGIILGCLAFLNVYICGFPILNKLHPNQIHKPYNKSDGFCNDDEKTDSTRVLQQRHLLRYFRVFGSVGGWTVLQTY